MSRVLLRIVLAILLATSAMAGPGPVAPVSANHDGNPTHATFQKGDLFVAIGDGKQMGLDSTITSVAWSASCDVAPQLVL